MGAPRFVSPGALAGNAIAQFLMERDIAEQKRVESEFKRQQQEADNARQAEMLKLQQKQEERIAAAQQQQFADLANEREFRRATTLVDTSLPGDTVDPATYDLLTKQGYGGAVQQTQPTQGAYLGDDENMVPQYNVVPGVMQMRGGAKYLQAQAQREAQAAQAEAARQAAAERAAESNQTRMAIAQMGAGNAAAARAAQAETTGLRNDLLQTQIAAAQQKSEDKAKADKKARDAARVTSGATIDVLKQLADFDESGRATLKPGTANLFGLRNPLAQLVPGSDTATAKAALGRLSGRVIVDLLNEMKNQSATGATGFGALSGPELRLLQDASTQLSSPNISDQRAAEELERIYKMARQLYGDEEPTAAAPAGKPSARDLIQKYGRR